jgi:hypothetical protein
MKFCGQRQIAVHTRNDRELVVTLANSRTAILPHVVTSRDSALRRLAIVVLQQSAKPRLASDFRHRDDIVRLAFPLSLRMKDQFVFQALMRSACVVIVDRFAEQVIRVLFPEDVEVIQNLGFERLDDPLNVGYNVWGTDGGLLDLGTRVREFGVETRSELAVPIMHHDFNAQLGLPGEPKHGVGLLLGPGIVRVLRAGRDVDSPRFDVNKYEHKHLANSQASNDSLREKVAFPERGSMDLDELVPRTDAPFRTRVESVFPQDVANGASANNTDAQFLQLAQNASEAPAILAGHFQVQPPKIDPGSGPTFFPPCHRQSPALANPAAKRVGVNDRDELIHGLAQLRTKANQPVPFVRSERNSGRQLISQDSILDLQVADMPSQFFLGRSGKYQEKPSVDVTHRGNFIKCSRGNGLASFLHTARTRSTWTKHLNRP